MIAKNQNLAGMIAEYEGWNFRAQIRRAVNAGEWDDEQTRYQMDGENTVVEYEIDGEKLIETDREELSE